MHFESIGARIKSHRLSLGLTQAELAARARVDRERVSNFERGTRTPTPEQLERIARTLGVELHVLVRNTDWLSPEERRQIRHGSAQVWREFSRPTTWRPPRDRDMSTRLRAALAKYGDLVRELLARVRKRSDGETQLRMFSTVAVGSALEALVQLFLLTQGALVWVAPEVVGFRRHPVVDPQTREGVGCELVPAFRIDLGALRCLLIPQVGLACRRATWCVDLLCATIDPHGTVRWLYVEIDGDGHDSTSDRLRTQDIDLPVIRLTEQDIVQTPFLQTLQQKLESVVPKRAA